MGEWVTMRHVESAGGADGPTARATRRAFDEVWAPKGWTEVDALSAKATEVLGEPVSDLNKLPKEKLKSLASQAGVDVAEDATKADIVADVTDALTPEATNG